MQNNPESDNMTVDEYSEKVYYCRNCHSLHIIYDETLEDEGWDGSYCAKCGSTNIAITTIGEWLAEEQRRELKRKQLEWKR